MEVASLATTTGPAPRRCGHGVEGYPPSSPQQPEQMRRRNLEGDLMMLQGSGHWARKRETRAKRPLARAGGRKGALDFGPSPFPFSILEHRSPQTLLLSGTGLEERVSLLQAPPPWVMSLKTPGG